VPALGRVTGFADFVGGTSMRFNESSARLIAAPDYLGDSANPMQMQILCLGLQGGTLSASTSMIWIQWVFCLHR
jgi:hypothetical protein